MKKLLAIIALLLCGTAHATTYYFSDCTDTASAIAGCVNGDDTYTGLDQVHTTGTTGPKRSFSAAATLYTTLSCGSQLLFAQGSAYVVSTQVRWENYQPCGTNRIVIGSWTPAAAAYCVGSGTITSVSATGLTDSTKSGIWTTNQFAGCDVVVADTGYGAKWTQRFKIGSNTTLGAMTLATYKDGTKSDINTWSYTPATGRAYTIVGPYPKFKNNTVNLITFEFLNGGAAIDKSGVYIRDLMLDGGSFQREIGSTTNSGNAVITDKAATYTALTTNELVGRTLQISGQVSTCYSNQNNYDITANTGTTVTLNGVIHDANKYSDFVTLTVAPTSATTGTLTAPFAGTTRSDYVLMFYNNDYNYYQWVQQQTGVTLTNGSTAVSWSGAVTASQTRVIFGKPCSPAANNTYLVAGGGIGFWFLTSLSDVTLDGVKTTGNSSGWISECTTTSLAAGSVGNPKNHKIINSAFLYGHSGTYSTCNELLIENNYFDHQGTNLSEHSIYLSSAATAGIDETPTQVVRGNRISNNNIGEAGLCQQVAFVKHGRATGLYFENNLMHEDAAQNNGGACWGASFDSGYSTAEGYTDVVMRGNTLVGYSGIGLGLDLTHTGMIENNQITCPVGFGDCTGIRMRSKSFNVIDTSPADFNPSNITIRNNTVNLAGATSGSLGIGVVRNPSDPTSLGGHKVYSNIIIFGSSTTASSQCFNADQLATSRFAGWNYNQCYSAGATPKWVSNVNTTDGASWEGAGTLAAAQAAGFDINSSTANPGITVGPAPGYALTITTGSAAYNSGSPTNSSPYALGGFKRTGVTGAPSKGAYEPNASTVLPGTPTKVRIQ